MQLATGPSLNRCSSLVWFKWLADAYLGPSVEPRSARR